MKKYIIIAELRNVKGYKFPFDIYMFDDYLSVIHCKDSLFKNERYKSFIVYKEYDPYEYCQ